MAEIDYNRDIAPLKGTYFNQLSPAGQSSLTSRYREGWEEVGDRQQKQQDRADTKRNRDLTYTMNVEALQARREDAQKKRDEEARLGTIASSLTAITTGEGSTDDRAMELNNFTLKNPQLLNNPKSAALLGASTAFLNAEATKKARADAKTKAELLATRPAMLAGDTAAVKAILTADEDFSEDDKKRVAAAETRQKELRDSALSGSKQQLEGKKLERRRKDLARTSKILSGVHEAETGDPLFFSQPSDEEAKKGATHSKRHMAALRLEYAKQHNLSPSAVAALGFSGEQLVDKIYERLQEDTASLDAAEEKLLTESAILRNFTR